ncbi:MAG: tetratricopeptide repeat protein, partial [Gemmatimonadota bacterium]
MNTGFWGSDEYDRAAERLYEAGDYDGALSILEQGLAVYPESAELRVSVGYAELAREQYAWARRSFERALALEPDHEDALVGLGEVLLKFGERGRAFRIFERLLELGFQDDVELLLSIGRALSHEGLDAHARRFFERAVRADRRSADAAAELAYSLYRQGEKRRARAWLERALCREPTNHEARAL